MVVSVEEDVVEVKLGVVVDDDVGSIVLNEVLVAAVVVSVEEDVVEVKPGVVVVDDLGSIVLVEVLVAAVVVSVEDDVVEVKLGGVVDGCTGIVVLADVEVFVVSDRVVVGFDVVLIMVLVMLDNDAKVVVLVEEVVFPDALIDLPVVSVVVEVDTATKSVKIYGYNSRNKGLNQINIVEMNMCYLWWLEYLKYLLWLWYLFDILASPLWKKIIRNRKR